MLILLLCVAIAVGAYFAFSQYQIKVVFPRELQRIKNFISEKEFEKARTVLNKLFQKKKKEPELFLLKAQCEEAQGQLILAIVTLNELLKLPAADSIKPEKIHEELARLYEKSGRGKEAITEFFLILDKDPHNFDANLKIGLYQYANGKSSDAEKYLLSAITIKADDIRAPLALGKIYHSHQNYVKAEKFLDIVLQIDHQNSEAMYLMGTIFLERQEVGVAIEYFKKCAGIGDAFVHKAKTGWAMAESVRRNDRESLRLYEESIFRLKEKDPLFLKGLRDLINVYIRNKKHSQLENALDVYLKNSSDDTDVQYFKDMYKNIFAYPKLSAYIGLPDKEFIIHNKKLFEKFGFVVDYERYLDAEKNSVMFKLIRYGKGLQKSVELAVFNLEPRLLVIDDLQKYNEQVRVESARMAYVCTPFFFKQPECENFIRTAPLSLVDGDLLDKVISGKNIF